MGFREAISWVAAVAALLGTWETGCVREGSASRDLILATTTSTQDTGLLDSLVPEFEARSGYRVKTIAVGTGQALEMGRRGEADVLLVHAPVAERQVVQAGAAVNRQLVMYNDFVLVGPPDDPAGVSGATSAVQGLKAVANHEALFVSRGDESGTHKRERALWAAAGVEPRGAWYQEAAVGMGQTLAVASEKGAYTLTDRATYLALRDRLALEVVLEGGRDLLNLYHVMQVNPERFDKVNASAAQAWVEYLLDGDTQACIGMFGIERFGCPLFTPAAGQDEEQVRMRAAESN